MNYKIVKYSEIGKIRSGKRLPKGYTVSEKISDNKYIRVRDINNGSIDSSIVQYITYEAAEKLERYKVKTRDVIISVVGTVGAIAQIDESLNGAYLTENCDNLQVDESLCLKDYLKYYLLSEDGSKEIIANTVGSTQPKLPIYGIENFNIKLPSIDNQKRIVKLLNSIDKKIKLNNEINNNLHDLCNNLYFRLVSQLNDTNSSVESIKNVAKCVLGGTPSRIKKEYWNGSINWINSGEINKFRIIKASEKITELGLNKSSTTLLPRGTTVLAITGATLGQVSRLEIDSCANQSVIGIITNKKELNNYMYLSILNSINDVVLKKTGGAQQHINKNDVETHEIIVPSTELISQFDEIIRPLFDQISVNCFEINKLEQLRDTLLPKLMNDEIDLDNIEI